MPRGVCKPGHVALLRRALYGAPTGELAVAESSRSRTSRSLTSCIFVVVPCTCFHEVWDVAPTYHSDDFMSESEPEYQDMVDEGLARNFDVKCLGQTGPGFRAEGRFLMRYVSWSVRRVSCDHGERLGRFIALMETAGCRSSAVQCNQSNGPRSARCRSGAGGRSWLSGRSGSSCT